MGGASHFLAVLVLAQTLGVSFPQSDPWLRLTTALLAGSLVLHASGHTWGVALLFAVLPITIWSLLQVMCKRWLRITWMQRAMSEAIFTLVALATAALAQPSTIVVVGAWVQLVVRAPALLSISVYLLTVFGGDRLIRGVVAPFVPHVQDDLERSLPRAGRLIGWCERSLIVTFVAAGFGEPVGWLIGAKAAIRYPEIRDEKTGRFAEYFLIGTLLSALLAVLGGLAVRFILG